MTPSHSQLRHRLRGFRLPVTRSPPSRAQGRGGAQPPPDPYPRIEDRTNGMRKIDGYFPLYWDERTGNLWLEIPRFDTDFLLCHRPRRRPGLERHRPRPRPGRQRQLVSFQRVGPKVLLVQGNESFRSSSANPAERRSVEDSFAKSVLWGFTVAAESNGRVLVDATDFFLRDGDGAGNSPAPRHLPRGPHAQRLLHAAHQGFPQEHRDRSDPDLHQRSRRRTRRRLRSSEPGTAAHPGARARRGGCGGGRGGGLFSGTVASVTPTAEAVTLREHYSLVELPDDNYQPRYRRSARRLRRPRASSTTACPSASPW